MPDLSRYAGNGYSVVTGQTFYSLRPIQDVSLRSDDRYYTVRPGDDWQSLGFRLLGHVELWWVLADYNSTLSPFDVLVAGTVIRYPSTAHLYLTILAT